MNSAKSLSLTAHTFPRCTGEDCDHSHALGGRHRAHRFASRRLGAFPRENVKLVLLPVVPCHILPVSMRRSRH